LVEKNWFKKIEKTAFPALVVNLIFIENQKQLSEILREFAK